MQHQIRVYLDDEEYLKLRSYLSHHGELSFILREAIREWIAKQEVITKKREEEAHGKGSRRGRAKSTEANFGG